MKKSICAIPLLVATLTGCVEDTSDYRYEHTSRLRECIDQLNSAGRKIEELRKSGKDTRTYETYFSEEKVEKAVGFLTKHAEDWNTMSDDARKRLGRWNWQCGSTGMDSALSSLKKEYQNFEIDQHVASRDNFDSTLRNYIEDTRKSYEAKAVSHKIDASTPGVRIDHYELADGTNVLCTTHVSGNAPPIMNCDETR